MRAHYTHRFLSLLEIVPPSVEKAFYKQIRLFVQDLRHPSLHAKKYDETAGVWQARVTKGWRFYFTINRDTYYLIDIKKHRD